MNILIINLTVKGCSDCLGGKENIFFYAIGKSYGEL